MIEEGLEIDIGQELIDSISQREEANANEKYPSEVFIFPLVRRPFFPGMAAPIVIEPGPFYDALKVVAKQPDKFIGLFLTKNEDSNIYETGFDDLYKVGVFARVLRIIPMESGGAQVILNIEKRITIDKRLSSPKHLKAQVSVHHDPPIISKELKAYSIGIISTIKELLKLNPLFKEELQIFLGHSDFTEPGKLADFAVALTTASREELQEILETFDLTGRIDKSLVLLKKELDLSKLQNSINQKIESSIGKTQREFFLREQLRTIKKELGLEKDDKDCDREKFETRIKEREIPEGALKVITEELEKLGTLETQSPEYAVCRNYLDWLTVLPWGLYTEQSKTLKEAREILEEDHYGLKEIKERILEFISVGKLTGGIKGSIICLVGPPGVGKTSIGKSIARALGRKFYRFSVGGMRDEAEIKGHRRTYIGAMPGKLIQALKFTESMNPVIMLDEIDKIGSSYHGDPASALLEVLDPEQNKDFLDHYLDVPFDLSHILFVVTANVVDTIPEALKDRMEILRLSGYITEEKVEIAKKYLIPRNSKENGLKASNITFHKTALKAIIDGYAREAGVRALEKNIKRILRKVAKEMVELMEKKKKDKSLPKVTVTPANIIEYLGNPKFTSDRFYSDNPVGVATGLAWTALGGATLYIESSCFPAEKTVMKLTGQAGDVMKESSQIAWTYLHTACEKYTASCNFFEKKEVHIHIPEGATPKDGPSAGITMVTSLLSLLTKTPVLKNLAMTGELTLTGRVLPIGGVREKITACKRDKTKVVILPSLNKRDFDELPDYVKEGIEVHFVDHYDEVLKVAFPTLYSKLPKKGQKSPQPKKRRVSK